MKQNKISLYTDLIFCLIILPVILALVPVDKWIVHQTTFMITLIVYIYALYFTHRKANIPSMFMHKKYTKAITIIAITILVTWLLSNFPIEGARHSYMSYAARRHLRSQTVWFFFLTITGFTLAIELVFELFKQILQKHEIETEKNKAELALYKSQINPHFLFNTLNALYALVISQSEYTESAFIKFSNILKYMYSQANNDTIDINNEIEYIKQYVDLQKLRLNHHTHIDLICDIDDKTLQIPPMILITFIENAFKYGTSSDEDCNILIKIKVKDGILHFETKNQIMKERRENTTAIGIENCRKRLELLYPNRFKLKTIHENNIYHTQLTIHIR